MRLHYLFNEHHRPLLDGFFLSTLKATNHGIEDIGVRIPEPEGAIRFGTERFKMMTTEKAKAVLCLIRREVEPFIVSDVDIQFFGPIRGEISDALSRGKDVMFQKESDIHGVNTGFMLIRPNERTAGFWESVVSKIASDPNERINDQHATNRLLGRGLIDYGVFGPRMWTYSQGNPRKDMLLHHANCTMDLEAKIRQLKRIRRFMGLNPS